MNDNTLEELAQELHNGLVRAGADPKNPPLHNGSAPGERAFAEYKRRGGTGFDNQDDFMAALIQRVGEI
jgi:hypothetical protein